jgi:hypothetical protein
VHLDQDGGRQGIQVEKRGCQIWIRD